MNHPAAKSKIVVIASNTPRFPTAGTLTLTDTLVLAYSRSSSNIRRDIDELVATIDAQHFELQISDTVDSINAELREFSIEHDLIYLDKSAVLCEIEHYKCIGITPTLRKMYYDYGHYTTSGAEEFGRIAHRIDWLKNLHEQVAERALQQMTGYW